MLLFFGFACGGYAKIIHVPQDPGMVNIYVAMSQARNGDEIIVSPGVYVGIVGIETNVNVHSLDPTNPAIVNQTIIKLSPTDLYTNAVITFSGNASLNETCRLAGFTITGGGTGISGNRTKATIEYNHIYGNNARVPAYPPGTPSAGGGIDSCAGLIQNNIIELNTANLGSGLIGCEGVIQNNIIARNVCWPASQGPSLGSGCAMDYSSGTIRNNTIVDNLIHGVNGKTIGGGLANCTGAIYNNIIWHSDPALTAEYVNNAPPAYSCIKGWTGDGTGNFNIDPRLANVAPDTQLDITKARQNDYHLKPDSPCIDAGVTSGSLTTDFTGLPVRGKVWRTQGVHGDGTHTDIGAYEFNPGPLSLWVPAEDEPGRSGRPLTVLWASAADAGIGSFMLELLQGGLPVAGLGHVEVPPGAHDTFETAVSVQAMLPPELPTGTNYVLRARWSDDGTTTTDSAPFAIAHQNAVLGRAWKAYR